MQFPVAGFFVPFGDEVIMPAYTYTASASVVAHVGAKVVQVEYQKTEYQHRREVAIELSEKFKEAGIRTTVLKGMAYGRYYRHPELRYSCDFDCILAHGYKTNTEKTAFASATLDAVASDANCASENSNTFDSSASQSSSAEAKVKNNKYNSLSVFEKGNKIAESLGASVDRSEQKHSHIQFNGTSSDLSTGVHIENHRECTGVSERGLEEYLTRMLFSANCETLDGTALELPPLMFDALFCLYHAQTHFVVEDGIRLRHVVDWVLIRRNLVVQGLYEACVADSKRFGLYRFMDALNGIADLVEGKKSPDELSEAERLLWEDIMHPQGVERIGKGWLAARCHVLHQIAHNSWKYRLYTDSSATKEIWKYLVRYCKRITT